MEKNKGITMIELIAGLVIISMIIIILVPIVTNYYKNSKENKYIEDVNTFIKEAENLRENPKYIKLFTKKGNNYEITLDKMANVKIIKDPFNYLYDKQASSITFKGENVIVNIKSCKKIGNLTKCYEIVDVNKNELNKDSITTTIN